MPYRGPGDPVPVRIKEDSTLTTCKSFIDCVRNKRQPFADVHVGFGSAMACSIGKHAVREQRIMKIPQLKDRIQI
jgi:hypothetical protein